MSFYVLQYLIAFSFGCLLSFSLKGRPFVKIEMESKEATIQSIREALTSI